MNIQFSYKQVPERDKNFLQEYIEKKDKRLATLVPEREMGVARLEVRVEKFAKKEAFKVELFLDLPTDQLMSGEDDHTVIEAFDLALDKLIIQLRKRHERMSEKNYIQEL